MSNPWKGLDSYTEEDVKQNFSFCGRTRAIGRLYSLINERLVSTLYGRTGCGKTSILQAGVFPLLRQDSFLPVMCRVSLRRKDDSFASYIITRVEDEMKKYGISYTDSEVPLNKLDDSQDYVLWKYMYGHKFTDIDGHEVFPVIILDQFEEILINDIKESELLLRQLDLLAGDTLALPENTYSNFRIVFSIREDFLFLLEDALDEGGFTQLRDNRMRLTAMSLSEAGEVVELGVDFFAESDYLTIKNVIIASSQDKRGNISTNMLSLCCSQCYELFKAKGRRLNETDIKQTGQSLLRDFYLSCVSNVSVHTRNYIEKHLVLNGRRNYVHKEQFLNHVPESDLKLLSSGKYKILQIITAGDSQGVELIHDSLARVVYEIYTETKQVNQKRQSKNTLTLFSIELVMWITLGILCVINPALNNMLKVVNLLVITANVFYSLASYGISRFSQLHNIIQLSINLLFIFVFFSLELDNQFNRIFFFLLLVLYISIPIANMTRSKDGTSKIGYMDTFTYVFGLKILSERPDLKPFLSRFALILFSISFGFLSLWFKSNWFLWIMFPICTVLMAWTLIGRWDERLNNPLEIKGLLLGWLGVSLLFTVTQFFGHLSAYWIAIAILPVWGAITALKYSKKSVIRIVASSIVIGLLLPHLFLGYFPSTNDHVRRTWSQPVVHLEKPNKALAFRGEDGKQGVLSINKQSKGVLFKPVFDSIDSLHCQLNGIVNYITVFSGAEMFDWDDAFLYRGDSRLLIARMNTLRELVIDWTEDSYRYEAEYAAACRTIGDEPTALSLEYDYFLRRMMSAEMYELLENSPYTADAESFEDLITIYSHRLKISSWKGNYVQEFVDVSQMNPILVDRSEQYLYLLIGNETEKSLTLGTIGDYKNAQIFKKLLISYVNDPVGYDSFINQLNASEDMLFQTRHSVGSFVIDSVMNAIYSSNYSTDCGFLLSNSWYNLFLCRFDKAEEYARASVEADSTRYITYTNLITSLWFQGKYDEAYSILSSKRASTIYAENTIHQYLFPLFSTEFCITLGEGVVQDMNHFIKTGVYTETSSVEFGKLKDILSTEFGLISDQGHYCYDNGIMLSVADDAYMIFNDNGWRLPVMTDIEIDIKDSVAICRLKSNGKYRFLDLRSWRFIGEEYEYAWHFSEGVAAVMNYEKIGFIDYDGNVVISPQFGTEPWLQKDHFRLAFHNGTCSVMDEDMEYRLIDISGNWYYDEIWDETVSFLYVKKKKDGMIIYHNKQWYATDSKSIVKSEKEKELDDIIYIQNQRKYKVLRNHFDVTEVEDLSSLPIIDISGVWESDDEQNWVYFSRNSSDFMWVNKEKVIQGTYYMEKILETPYLYLVLEDDSEVWFLISDVDEYDLIFDNTRKAREILQSKFGAKCESVPAFYKLND
jgi:hypothetical protein